jgi:hypothetical protein
MSYKKEEPPTVTTRPTKPISAAEIDEHMSLKKRKLEAGTTRQTAPFPAADIETPFPAAEIEANSSPVLHSQRGAGRPPSTACPTEIVDLTSDGDEAYAPRNDGQGKRQESDNFELSQLQELRKGMRGRDMLILANQALGFLFSDESIRKHSTITTTATRTLPVPVNWDTLRTWGTFNEFVSQTAIDLITQTT